MKDRHLCYGGSSFGGAGFFASCNVISKSNTRDLIGQLKEPASSAVLTAYLSLCALRAACSSSSRSAGVTFILGYIYQIIHIEAAQFSAKI